MTNIIERVDKLKVLNLSKNFRKNEFFILECFSDMGLLIATRKFEELEHLYKTAHFTLREGSHSNHGGITCNKGDDIAQQWRRFEFLKNAIIWYNSCFDYVLQIVYFAFDFADTKKIEKHEDYANTLKKCKWEQIEKKLILKAKTNNHAEKLLTDLSKLRGELKPIRDWANTLKHNGLLEIDSWRTHRHSVSIEKENGSKINTDIFLPQVVKMNNVLDTLIKGDEQIVNFTYELYDFIGFNGELPRLKDMLYGIKFKKKFSMKNENN